MTMSVEAARAFAARWLPAWTGNDPERLVAFYAPGATYIDPAVPRGRQPWHQCWLGRTGDGRQYGLERAQGASARQGLQIRRMLGDQRRRQSDNQDNERFFHGRELASFRQIMQLPGRFESRWP